MRKLLRKLTDLKIKALDWVQLQSVLLNWYEDGKY